MLAPTVRPAQIVVVDNRSAPKSVRVRAMSAAQGCTVWSLPAYAPALSPSEEACATLNALLRRAEARTAEALEHAIAHALEAITTTEARAFLRHCGYGLAAQ